MKRLSPDSEIFTRTVEDIVTREELQQLLAGKKQLRVKLGIDAAAADLHIGHAVNLWKIRALQDAGHKAVIILGDFTTQIGDPTGKSQTRPMLPPAVIKKNIVSLKKQIEKILLTSPGLLEIRQNSEWFGKMKTAEFLNLSTMVTHARLIQRDMFQQRIKEQKEITIAEILYPVLQGYDSVMIASDLTIIGSDQLFNEHMGRFFQERFKQKPQVIVTHRLVAGLSGGEKMSKSLGNYIALNDSPQDKFGKTMRVLDSLIIPYLESYTAMPLQEIDRMRDELEHGRNPMEAKLILAQTIVARYHGPSVARRAKDEFLRVFSRGDLPEVIPDVALQEGVWNVIDLLVAAHMALSRSEARRLAEQGAVEIDGVQIGNNAPTARIKKSSIIRVGRRKFARVV